MWEDSVKQDLQSFRLDRRNILVYTDVMASLQRYSSGGRHYWRIVESYREGGRPKIRVLMYLGTADRLLARLRGENRRLTVESKAHGHVAALWEVARKIDAWGVIDRALARHWKGSVPTRQGLTPGEACVLVALGRVCRPTSKRAWSRWAEQTSLSSILGRDVSKLSSQFFWDQMERIPRSVIPEIERELAARALRFAGSEIGLLLYDTTNFYTFLSSTNERSRLAKRGKNKQKRSDLRQVGLALLVGGTSRLPLWHRVYQGDRPDVTLFSSLLGELRERIMELARSLEEITFVCDRGNNASRKNQSLLDASGLHYVAALTPAHHRRLIEEANGQLQWVTLDSGSRIRAHRCRREIWGRERTVVVYLSEALRDGQRRGLWQHLDKRMRQLDELAKKCAAPNARSRNREQLEKRIARILSGQYIREVLRAKVHEDPSGRFRVEWELDNGALCELTENWFGRRILITDRHDWPTQRIIQAYRGQYEVERVFRVLKNPFHCALRPQYHWTDQKIEVHAFCCVLGYLLARLLHLQALQKSSFRGELPLLLDRLRQIRRAVVLESPLEGKEKPRLQTTLDHPRQAEVEELIEAFEIKA